MTECLLYASLLTLVASRRLYDVLAPPTNGPSQPYPIDRWAVLFGVIADQLLHLLVGPRAHRPLLARRLGQLILHEARDPNRRRLLLPVRAQLGQIKVAA